MRQPLVFLHHARTIARPGQRILCLAGIRAWCERYEIDFAEFSESGIAGERFISIGDAWGLKALAIAQAEVNNGQQ